MNHNARFPDGRPDFAHIRSVYETMMPTLLASECWVDPYFLDWQAVFTPIESQMWSLIRSQRLPFYPQFPVGRYFVDFGNPRHKIAIECDGKQWHDDERDAARDAELRKMGWRVVRFSGRSCFLLPWLPDLSEVRGITPAAQTEWLVEELRRLEQYGEAGEWQSEEEAA